MEREDSDELDSEEDNANRVRMSKVSSRKRKPFYFSNGMPIKDRILIFKQDFVEFAGLDDEQTKKLIEHYDCKANMSRIKADPSISIIGGLLIWTGWLFMTCAAGYNIVDFDAKHVPQKIAMNVMMSAAGAGITHQLFNLGQALEHQRMKVFEPEDLMTSVLSGLVSITAACNNVDIVSSYMIGSIATLLLTLTSKLLIKHKIDDPIGFFQIFGISGLWGCLAVGFLDKDNGLMFTGAFL